MADSPRGQLVELIAGHLDGWNSPAQFQQLEQLLDSSAASRQFYIDHLDMHARLLWERGSKGKASSPTISTSRRPKQSRSVWQNEEPLETENSLERLLQSALEAPTSDALQPKTVASKSSVRRIASPFSDFLANASVRAAKWPVTLIALIGVLSVLGYYVWPYRSQTNSATIAYLTAAKNCQWEQQTVAIGDPLTNGPLRLRAGVARLEFADGAQCVVEGPCDFELRSAASMYLARGKLMAQVPARANGFTVETRTAKIVDRGTEFVVEVDAHHHAKLAVTKGTVDLIPAAGKLLHVFAGKAMTISNSDTSEPAIAPASFGAAWIQQTARLNESLPSASQEAIAYQIVPDDAAGNESAFRGGISLDFDVVRPIRVSSLGVFDHLGDGIAADSHLTVQLWSRDNRGTPKNPVDDRGNKILAEAVFSANDPGLPMSGHRFKPLANGLELPPGSYSIVVFGCSKENLLANLTLRGAPTSHVETSGGAIAAVGSRFQDHISPGQFPSLPARLPVSFAAGSFRFTPVDAKSSK